MCPGLLDQNTNLWVILAYFLAPGTIKIPSGKCSSISKYLWKYIHYFLVQGQNSLQTTILSEQTSGQEITNDCCTLDMLFNFFLIFLFYFLEFCAFVWLKFLYYYLIADYSSLLFLRKNWNMELSVIFILSAWINE